MRVSRFDVVDGPVDLDVQRRLNTPVHAAHPVQSTTAAHSATPPNGASPLTLSAAPLTAYTKKVADRAVSVMLQHVLQALRALRPTMIHMEPNTQRALDQVFSNTPGTWSDSNKLKEFYFVAQISTPHLRKNKGYGIWSTDLSKLRQNRTCTVCGREGTQIYTYSEYM